ncbi:hypothetical protein AB9X29_003782 [Vibrio vulnificus]
MVAKVQRGDLIWYRQNESDTQRGLFVLTDYRYHEITGVLMGCELSKLGESRVSEVKVGEWYIRAHCITTCHLSHLHIEDIQQLPDTTTLETVLTRLLPLLGAEPYFQPK